MVIGSYATPDHRGMPRVWGDVLSFIFGLWGCLGWPPVWQTGQQIGSNPIRSTIGASSHPSNTWMSGSGELDNLAVGFSAWSLLCDGIVDTEK